MFENILSGGKRTGYGRPYANRGVLMLEDLYDEFLSLFLKKINPGHDTSLSLCLSSCRQSEGVSTITFNIAVSLSRNTDKRILLVDTNTRTPKLHSWLKMSSESPGIIDILNGDASFEDTLVRDQKRSFAFIPAGSKIKHPIVLFDGLGFDSFLSKARRHFDIILFDAPALQSGPETGLLARKLDGFIMVIEAERTRWEVAEYHKQQLIDSGVRFTGAILNKKKMFIPRLIYRLLLAD